MQLAFLMRNVECQQGYGEIRRGAEAGCNANPWWKTGSADRSLALACWRQKTADSGQMRWGDWPIPLSHDRNRHGVGAHSVSRSPIVATVASETLREQNVPAEEQPGPKRSPDPGRRRDVVAANACRPTKSLYHMMIPQSLWLHV